MSNNDPIREKTLSWTFDDGAMKGKTFEHTFGADGTVSFRCTSDDKMTGTAKYELAKITDRIYAVSYLVPGSATLTTILDLDTGKMTAFSSMDKQGIAQHHGRFSVMRRAA